MARRAFARFVVPVATGACVLATAWFGSPAVAASANGEPLHISATAMQQIAAIRAEKASRTPAQRKIDSHLLYAEMEARHVALPPGFLRVPTGLPSDPKAQVTVDVAGTFTTNFLTTARAQGAKLTSVTPNAKSVRLRMPLGNIEALAASPDVTFVKAAVAPQIFTGSVDSEGDTTHEAAMARANYNVDGTGIKIGVLSDGVTSLSASQASGDLGPVTVLSGQAGPANADEGTAMLQIIHDLAPGAQLFFATASNSEASFAQNIRDLRTAGCDIIVDDAQYYDESPFQDGPVAQAVNDVTASGALYFSAAGNSGNLDDGTSGTWEGDFTPYTDTSGNTWADFDPSSAIQIGDPVALVSSDETATLQWADPLGGSANDYDLYLLDSNGNLLASSTNNQTGTQDPYESLTIPGSAHGGTAGRFLAIGLYSGSPRFMHLALNGGPFASASGLNAFATAGAISGHNGAAASFSIGATPAHNAIASGQPQGPYPNGFSSSNDGETFSSDGPRRVFFAADGTPYTPGNFSSTGGQVLQKPDFTAADGVATTVPGFQPFFGTSAAAPHAAAIAALMLQEHPGLTSAQVRSALSFNVIDIQAPGWDRDTGAGIINAPQAVQNVDATPPSVVSTNPAPGATGLSMVSSVSAAVSERLQAGATITVTPQGGSPVAGSVALNPAWTVVTFTPAVVLPPSRTYTAVLSGVKDLAGNAMADYSWTFTTAADTTPPSVVTTVPASGASGVVAPPAVSVTFDEPIQAGATLGVTPSGGSAVAGTTALNSLGTVLTFTPATALPAATYTAVVSGVKDLSGNAMADYSWSFTTAASGGGGGGGGAGGGGGGGGSTGTPTVVRDYGSDRYGTAAAVSFDNSHSPLPVVYVATGEDFPDALAAGAAAGKAGGRVLLVEKTSIPPATADALTRLAPQQIVVVGGPGVISDQVVNGLRTYTSGTVGRTYGPNRYATAAALAAWFSPGLSDVLIATGVNYPDALAGAAAAGAAGIPVLLVTPTAIPLETVNELKVLKPQRITILGGTGAVSAAVESSLAAYAPTVRRLSGADRYATAAAISHAYFGSAGRAFLATGSGFADALSAAALAAEIGGPVLLSDYSCVPAVNLSEFSRLGASVITLIGGPGALSPAVQSLTACSG